MSKQAYYFSHDSNARNDEKILAVRMKLGMEGYGIYWSILEKMRENSDYMCIKDYNVIAFDLRVSSDKIKALIEDFDLFEFTEDRKKFFSKSFIDRMSKKDEKSENAKKAAKKRWSGNTDKQKVNADAMQPHSERITDGMPNKGKESKVNKSKEREDARALDFLKKENPQRFETDFLMRYKSKIKNPKKFTDDFNDTVDQENLEYSAKILFARLGKYARNWIENERKYGENQHQHSKTDKPKFAINR
tara:strand:+ start:15220 stop:15960 length:741 start_codon:yes stop_codon:yes gene_type:complete